MKRTDGFDGRCEWEYPPKERPAVHCRILVCRLSACKLSWQHEELFMSRYFVDMNSSFMSFYGNR